MEKPAAAALNDAAPPPVQRGNPAAGIDREFELDFQPIIIFYNGYQFKFRRKT
jgi:hypothetical protein